MSFDCLICLDSRTTPTWKPMEYQRDNGVYVVDRMIPCKHCQLQQHKFIEGVCLCGKRKVVGR